MTRYDVMIIIYVTRQARSRKTQQHKHNTTITTNQDNNVMIVIAMSLGYDAVIVASWLLSSASLEIFMNPNVLRVVRMAFGGA